MITGKIQYVVIEKDDMGGVIAAWGPFPDEDEAQNWEPVSHDPSTITIHCIAQMRTPPQWFEGATESNDE